MLLSRAGQHGHRTLLVSTAAQVLMAALIGLAGCGRRDHSPRRPSPFPFPAERSATAAGRPSACVHLGRQYKGAAFRRPTSIVADSTRPIFGVDVDGLEARGSPRSSAIPCSGFPCAA